MPDPYVKQTWIDGVAGATPISAARLTYIEDGIENATVEDGTYGETPDGEPMVAASAHAGAQAAQGFLAKLRQGANATALVLGDSTGDGLGAWVYLWVTALAPQYPALSFDYYGKTDNAGTYNAATRIQTGSGSGVVSIYNASDSGSRLPFSLGNFATLVQAVDPDVVLINHGHNESRFGTGDGEDFMERYLALVESVTEAHPGTGVIAIAQNPATANTHQTGRAQALYQLGAMRGYDVVNVWQAFVNTGDAAALTVDGVHPTAAGYALWAAEVARAFRYNPGTTSRPRQPSSLLSSGESLFANANFEAFTAAMPTGWTSTNATAAKDLTNYKSPNGYGVRLTETAAGASVSMYADCPYLNLVKGEWVTVVALMRTATGAVPAQVNLQTFGTGAMSRTSASYSDDPVGEFYPKVLSIKVPSTASILRCRIYARVGSAGTADTTVDRLVFMRGRLPALGVGIGGPTGATGPAGPAGPAGGGVMDYQSTNGHHPALDVYWTTQNGNTFPGSGQAIWVPFIPKRDITLAKLQWFVGTGVSGNYDMAIKDAAGNTLWALGSTAWPSSASAPVVTVSPSLALTEGTVYWLVMSGDNATGTFKGPTAGGTAGEVYRMLDGTFWARLTASGAFPIPDPLAVPTAVSTKVPLVIFREA